MTSKDLPPLPASDDESSEEERTASQSHSPSPRRPLNSRTTSTSPSTTSSIQSTTESLFSLRPESTRMDKPAAPYPPGLPVPLRQSRKQLRKLRASFQDALNTLRKKVQDTPVSSLNDVRRAFRSTARGTGKRLAAWHTKHVPGAPVNLLGDVTQAEPEWWSVTCHTVPGGRVVVREGEWGSVIAFTLR
jgi:1-phosphatidylinositol-3-phosphate 5-kinase